MRPGGGSGGGQGHEGRAVPEHLRRLPPAPDHDGLGGRVAGRRPPHGPGHGPLLPAAGPGLRPLPGFRPRAARVGPHLRHAPGGGGGGAPARGHVRGHPALGVLVDDQRALRPLHRQAGDGPHRERGGDRRHRGRRAGLPGRPLPARVVHAPLRGPPRSPGPRPPLAPPPHEAPAPASQGGRRGGGDLGESPGRPPDPARGILPASPGVGGLPGRLHGVAPRLRVQRPGRREPAQGTAAGRVLRRVPDGREHRRLRGPDPAHPAGPGGTGPERHGEPAALDRCPVVPGRALRPAPLHPRAGPGRTRRAHHLPLPLGLRAALHPGAGRAQEAHQGHHRRGLRQAGQRPGRTRHPVRGHSRGRHGGPPPARPGDPRGRDLVRRHVVAQHGLRGRARGEPSLRGRPAGAGRGEGRHDALLLHDRRRSRAPSASTWGRRGLPKRTPCS